MATMSSSALLLWLWVVATVALCGVAMSVAFLVVRRLPAGLPRMLALGPFLPAFVVMNGLVPSASARAALSFTFCWATPCKLLLLCFGCVVDWPAWALSRFSYFLLAFLLPVRIKGPAAATTTDDGATPSHLSKHLPALACKLSVLLCLVSFYDLTPEPITHPLHCLVLFLVLDLPHRTASILLHAVFRVDVHPTFHKPWLSPSLTDFWGKRWNLTANALLRHTVYNPLINHLSKAPFSTAQPRNAPLPLCIRLVAVCATFLTSGLLHELLYFSLTQAARPTWEVTAFFVLHGFATSIEITLRRACPHHFVFKLPEPVKVLLTVGFLYATAAWLFFSPLVSSQVFLKCTSEFLNIKRWISRDGMDIMRIFDSIST